MGRDDVLDSELIKFTRRFHYFLLNVLSIVLTTNIFNNIIMIIRPEIISLEIKAYGALSPVLRFIGEIILAVYIFLNIIKLANDKINLVLITIYTIVRISMITSGLIRHRIIFTNIFTIYYILFILLLFILLGMGIMLYTIRILLHK